MTWYNHGNYNYQFILLLHSPTISIGKIFYWNHFPFIFNFSSPLDVMHYLTTVIPKNAIGIIALSWIDFYPDEHMNSILGEGSVYSGCAAISFGHYGLYKPENESISSSRSGQSHLFHWLIAWFYWLLYLFIYFGIIYLYTDQLIQKWPVIHD